VLSNNVNDWQQLFTLSVGLTNMRSRTKENNYSLLSCLTSKLQNCSSSLQLSTTNERLLSGLLSWSNNLSGS